MIKIRLILWGGKRLLYNKSANWRSLSCWFQKCVFWVKSSVYFQRPCEGFTSYTGNLFSIDLRMKTAFEVGFSKIMNYFQIISLTMRVRNHNAGRETGNSTSNYKGLMGFSNVEILIYFKWHTNTVVRDGLQLPNQYNRVQVTYTQ